MKKKIIKILKKISKRKEHFNSFTNRGHEVEEAYWYGTMDGETNLASWILVWLEEEKDG